MVCEKFLPLLLLPASSASCWTDGLGGTYHSMELAAFVALGKTTGIFALAGAELTEVLGGSGDDVGE